MSKRVLITGSSGFVGRYLVAYLKLFTDWEIVESDKDLTNRVSYTGEFDYVVNLASQSSVEKSVQEPHETIYINTSIISNLLDYCRNHPPELFLHFSTVEVYNITNPYAASKAAQEAIAEAYWKTYDIPLVIARSTNIIGPGQSADKFVPKVIKQIKNAETVEIYASGKTPGKRTYNSVYNVADAIYFLLNMLTDPRTKKPDWQEAPRHYDIDGGTELTNLEMAQLLADKLGQKLKYKIIQPQQQRPSYAASLRPTASKLTKSGWTPTQTIREALAWVQ